jgi:hypothetical protein
MHYIFGLVIFLILIFLYVVFLDRNSKYIDGVWIGNPSFLKESLLKHFQLVITSQSKRVHYGYLIIIDKDGNFISNQPIKLISKLALNVKNLTSTFNTDNQFYGKISIQFSSDDPLPKELNIKLSSFYGTLTLYDNKKIYAHLEKDISSSLLLFSN